jgi:hypothetical protein
MPLCLRDRPTHISKTHTKPQQQVSMRHMAGAVQLAMHALTPPRKPRQQQGSAGTLNGAAAIKHSLWGHRLQPHKQPHKQQLQQHSTTP